MLEHTFAMAIHDTIYPVQDNTDDMEFGLEITAVLLRNKIKLALFSVAMCMNAAPLCSVEFLQI